MTKSVEFNLRGVLKLLSSEEDEGYVLVTLLHEQFSVTARGEQMSFKLGDDQQVAVRVKYVDEHGHDAAVEGNVVWDSSDLQVATVQVQADTKQAIVVSGSPGTCQISATADADLGAGTTELVCTLDVEVVAGAAVSGTIEPVGAPTPKTD